MTSAPKTATAGDAAHPGAAAGPGTGEHPHRLHSPWSTLRGRVFIATLAASLVAVGIALAIGVYTTRQTVRDSVAAEVRREAELIAARTAVVAGSLGSDDLLITREQLPDPLRGLVSAPAGGESVNGSSDGGATGNGAKGSGPPALPPGAGDRGGDRRVQPMVLPISVANTLLPAATVRKLNKGETVTGRVRLGDARVMFAAAPVSGHDLFVLATRSDAVISGDNGRYLTGLLIAALIAAGISAAAAALLARRITRPIADVAEAAGALAAGRTPQPVPEPSTAELAELARSFNEMSTNLSQAREAERTVLMSASHELRTPLTAISGYAEGVQDGTIDAQTGIGVIRSEAARLEGLVQDLLVLARLEQGTFETRSERVDLAQTAETVRERLALRAESGGVELTVSSKPGSTATADSGRVLQVVANLVDNAVRVTPRGGRVTIETASGSIRVSDTGPGIPRADLPHVFERFHLRRVHGMGSPDGSGIGLAIVRELTEAMGGRVSVESGEGAGAVFTVNLPTAG